MDIWVNILEIIKTSMTVPKPWGWFHILWLVISIAAAFILFITQKTDDDARIRRVVVTVAAISIVLEIYKQICFNFDLVDGASVYHGYEWYAFPFQFCSLPMYVGLLCAFFKNKKILDMLYAFLATYSIFAGVCVMVYPVQVFVGTLGINVQTMFCHGSMITVGIYLLATKAVRTEHKTILRAMPVFLIGMVMAIIMNELAYRGGVLEKNAFNMFYISPHCPSTLPVYSAIQPLVPYLVELLIYFAVFSLAAYVILLIAMGIGAIIRSIIRKEK